MQNVINSALALTDIFMVGTLGEQQLSAVTLANNIFFVLMLITFGIQSGSGILISQYWGRGDTHTINRVIGVGLMLSAAISGLFVSVVMLFPRQIMSLTTSETALIGIGVEYLVTIAPAFLFNAVAMLLLGAHRSIENARIGLLVLTFSMCINTLLNYMLIFGVWGAPAMGVRGSATATLIARVLELVLTIIYVSRNKRLPMHLSLIFKPGIVIFRDFIKYSMPVVINETLWGFGFTMYPLIVGHMANATSDVASYSIALSTDRIFASLFLGVGSAVGIILGKTLGQNRPPEEVYDLSKLLLKVTVFVSIGAAALLALLSTFVFVPHLFPLFRDMTPETEHTTWLLLMICSVNMIVRSLNFTIIVGVLRGGGDTKAAAIIDIVFLYGVGLPLAYTFGLLLEWGVMFIFVAVFIEEAGKAVASVLRLRKRRWIVNITQTLD